MPTPEREREIYAEVVRALPHADASHLVRDLNRGRRRVWPTSELVSVWREAAEHAAPHAAWNMYVHVPFCKSICTFCNYKRLRVSSREALDAYVHELCGEMQRFAPALKPIRFTALYVGGGTPSVLAAAQLERLFGALHDDFSFAPDAQKNFEYDPMVMTDDRFSVVERFGFTRFSFGVQSIDVNVNTLHGRGPQGRGHVAKQFSLLSRHDARNVNVDFLFGLAGTTPRGIVAEIDETMRRHRPDEVTVYFVTPPPAYLAHAFGGKMQRFEAHMAPFRAHADALHSVAEAHGYRVATHGKHVVVLSDERRKERRLRKARGRAGVNPRALGGFGESSGLASPERAWPGSANDYCDITSQAHRPLYLLGLGDSARSQIFAQARYTARHEEGAVQYLGSAVSRDDEMFAYVAFALRDGELVRSRFLRTFGASAVEVYARPLRRLHQLGAVIVTSEAISLRAEAPADRLRDTLFFLPSARRPDLRHVAQAATSHNFT